MGKQWKKHEIFLAGLISITLGLSILVFKRAGLQGQVDPLGWMLLGTVVYTEIMQMFYDDQVSMSLSGPVLIFSVFTQPFWFSLMLVVFCTISGKIFQTYYYHEQERVLDVKLVFNLFQYLFMVTIIEILALLHPFGGVMEWAFAAILYSVVNILLTGTVISLYSGRNEFGVYLSKSTLAYAYFQVAIVALLVYTYNTGGLMGTVLTFMVLLPMQGEILQRASVHKLNPRLIKDDLTGAFNRSHMKQRITEWLHHKKEFALLFMDLDDFKVINDSYGHVVGDKVLVDFVKEVQKDLRQEDKIFRFGGDEFCVLFHHLTDAKNVHNRWKGEWLDYQDEEGHVISYTFSAGIVEYREEDELNYYELLDKVDQQMYMEKQAKGKRVGKEIS